MSDMRARKENMSKVQMLTLTTTPHGREKSHMPYNIFQDVAKDQHDNEIVPKIIGIP